MAKKSALDRAIEALDSEMAVLYAAKQKLLAQQQTAKPRKPRGIPLAKVMQG